MKNIITNTNLGISKFVFKLKLTDNKSRQEMKKTDFINNNGYVIFIKI